MARQIIEKLIDDIDGSQASTTVSFRLDGHTYTIDLNDKHDRELRAVLAPYLAAAHRIRSDAARISGARPPSGPVGDKARTAAIRAWALMEGVELPTRGRIANAVQHAYDAGDGNALRDALGLVLVEEKPRRRRRTEAMSSDAA